jgi:hypothetical protein
MSATGFDFDVAVEQTEDGAFVHVLASPLGETLMPLAPPFSQPELAHCTAILTALGSAELSQEAALQTELRALGQKLFGAIFRERVGAYFQGSYRLAYEQRAAFRLRLHLAGLPEAAQWPWEYLFDLQRNEFLALSLHSPLTRYLALMHQIPRLKVKPPLRMLAVIASPGRYPLFDVDEEWTAFVDQLDHLAVAGRMLIDRLTKPTLFDLQRRLRERQYHLLHFIGHAHFDTQMQEGYLVFEDEMGRGRLVSGQHMGAMLRDHFALRLVGLHACPGARLYRQNPYAAVAQHIVRRGVPAAVVSQVKIPGEPGLVFVDQFYRALVDHAPVEAAITGARRTVYEQFAHPAWGVPQLITRTVDGKLFETT